MRTLFPLRPLCQLNSKVMLHRSRPLSVATTVPLLRLNDAHNPKDMHALFFLQSRFRQPGTLSGQGHPTLWQLWRARLQTHSCLSVGALAFHLLLLLLTHSSSLAFSFFSFLASSSIFRHPRALFCCSSFKCFSPLSFFSCSPAPS